MRYLVMGLFKSKPLVGNPLAEKAAYIGLPTSIVVSVFAAAGFTVHCIAVKPEDGYHPPNDRYNSKRVFILYDWISQMVREIHVG